LTNPFDTDPGEPPQSAEQPPSEGPFRVAPSFHAADDTGSFAPGDFEALYEELFAEALDAGPISDEERERLDLAAGALGIDAERLERLEQALLAAYEARAAITSVDTPAPDSLAERERVPPRQPSIPELDEVAPAEPPPSQPHVKPSFLKSGIPLPFAPESDPNDELHDRFASADPDEQFRVASVLVNREAANAVEEELFEAHRPRSPLRPQQPLTARAWSELLLHPDEDRLPGEIFGVIASAALLGRVSAMRRDRSLPRLDPEAKQDPSTSTVSATRAIAWAAATMGMKAPPIYLLPESDVGMEIVTALPPALRVGARMLRGKTAVELAFHAGRALTWFRSEHFVCTLVPNVAYLEDLFLAALRIGAPTLAMPSEVRARVDVVKNAMLPVLEPAQIATLRFHVSAFVDRGGRASLRAWARACELTACRAGLLLSGDLAGACAAVEVDAGAPERAKDLETFWLSEECAKLRVMLGVAIR
jgi:hypothetical protein